VLKHNITENHSKWKCNKRSRPHRSADWI